jgi:gamma-glutamyltranspeptidase/glutathione hydrolase
MNKLLLALTALTLPALASAQGVVTSADPRATLAGQEMLRQGGTAADAAMAMMLALTVVEPQSSGIGGGGFLLHHDGATGLIDTIDGRETAPAAATPDRFLGPDGKPKPFFDAFPGGKSVGVPGNVRLMALTHARWGKLPWKTLFAPAIKLAEQGYQVTRPMNAGMTATSRLWGNFPEIAKLYSDRGEPLAIGTTVKNPKLGKYLRKLADGGPDAFYTGDNAKTIVDTASGSKLAPSDITLADLAAYQAKPRAAVCGRYRVYKICGMGPPSSGGVTVLQILGMLERFDMAKLGKESPVAWHLIGEAMQLAYADRDTYLGDRDFVSVPLAGLIDPAYIKARSRLISASKTLASYQPGTPPGAEPRTHAPSGEVPSTTHFIAIDGRGDVVTMTSTVEGPFGSQLIANGYVLNNELTDFTFAPKKDGMAVANRVQGGKRPLSSMAPTIVYDATGKPIFTVGAAGGRTIIMQVAKALIAHLDWKESARDSIGEGLVFFNKDGLVLEQGTTRETLLAPLEKLGHKVVVARLGLKANAAELTPAGWVGAADPRSVGTALAQ